MLDPQDLTLIGIFVLVAEAGGIALAIHAVLHARSSQAAIAWSIALISVAPLAIPLYVVFGRSRFHGYVCAIRDVEERVGDDLAEWRQAMAAHAADLPPERHVLGDVVRRLGEVGFTTGNRVTLLVDGEATYGAMLEAIGSAESYVLVQFFIVRDDGIGRRLRDALIQKAVSGVRVCFLYDEIGSVRLPRAYLDPMREAGIEVSGFKTTRGRGNRFQINFRNHRKLLVVDGRTGFIGGLNLGDEYLSYRDTHVRIDGPAARHIHLSFAKDWFWATRSLPGVGGIPEPQASGDEAVAIAPTGPADDLPACSVLLLVLIASARRRLWMTSPYFVPDDITVRALQSAALRGVDVRVVLPGKADKRFVELASCTYYTEMLEAGVQLFRLRDRFLHQKVMLVDDDLATIGTVNLDNRSIYLNFEATAIVYNEPVAAQVREMLKRDLEHSDPVSREQYCDRSLLFRLAARVARLFSPLL